jgi:hypothetical protein
MDAACLSFLDEYMERISDYSGTIILMGDFNLNLLQSSYYINKYRNIPYCSEYRPHPFDGKSIVKSACGLFSSTAAYIRAYWV